METSTKANGKMTKSMEMEYIHGQMGGNIKEDSKIIFDMDVVFTLGLMVLDIKVIIKTI